MKLPSPSDPTSARAETALEILSEWALARVTPFTAAQACVGVGPRIPLPRSRWGEIGSMLSEHPGIVRRGNLFFTPRVLAMSLRFRIRLMPEERAGRFLVPGHRFLPFAPLDYAPDQIRLVRVGQRRESLPRKSTLVSVGGLSICHSLISGTQSQDKPDSERLPWSVFDLSGFPLERNGMLPEEWVAACHDFDALTFVLAPLEGKAAQPGESSALSAGLKEAVFEPWEGPRTAPRQILAAVARCWSDPPPKPIGPIGPVLTAHPLVGLDPRSAAPVVVRRGEVSGTDHAPGEGLVPDAMDPVAWVEALEVELRRLPRASRKRGAAFGGRIGLWTWDPETTTYRADLLDESGAPLHRVGVELDEISGELFPECDCSESWVDARCEHVAAALENLIATVKAQRGIAAPDPAGDWRRILEAIDAAPPDPPARDQRITWRVSLEHDGLALYPFVQKRAKGGGWSAGRQLGVDRLSYMHDPWVTPQDRTVAFAVGYRGDIARGLELLAGHPLVFIEGGDREGVAVVRATLRLQVAEVPGGHEIVPALGDLVAGEDTVAGCVGEHLVFYSPRHCRIAFAPIPPAGAALLRALLDQEAVFPPEAAEQIQARLPKLEALLPVDPPAAWAGELRPADARIRVRLTPDPAAGLTVSLHARPLPAPAPAFAPGEGSEEVRDRVEGVRVRARRDRAAESEQAREIVGRLDLQRFTQPAPWTWRVPGDDAALDLVVQLQAAAGDDLVVEWPEDGRIRDVTRPATMRDLRVGLTRNRDWFGLGGSVEVDGETVPLADLLEALRQGRRYVPVTGGKWLRIADELGGRLGTVAQAVHGARGQAELGPTAAPLLAELIREAGTVKACAAWRELEQRFTSAMSISPELPEGFTAELRPYQREGYVWMRRLAEWGVGGCLADDMGLGKTVQALAVLVARASLGPALVVAPVSVGTNWLRETRRFAPGLAPVLYRETDRAAGAPPAFGPGDLVITSYGLLLRDVERLSAVRWGTFLLDEAQFVKNSRTKSAQAIRRIAADWRFALTGTPVENHLGDLWSLFRAVSPGLFGSWEEFRTRFAVPIERERNGRRRDTLARLVRPFVLRRTKSEVLKDLPARTEVRLSAELSPAERKLYESARLAALEKLEGAGTGGSEDRRFVVLAALTRLRQLACHPRLVFPEADAGSAKLQVFLDTVEELRAEGHRALVFSQFTSHLALVRAELDARRVTYQYLDGSTPPAKRDEAVTAFQRGEGDLFLISLKAGGTGLNLTGADYVIHLDPWWNPAVEDQATDRAHRIGQTKPVMVYRIVAAGTIEEQILALHADKRDLVAGVLAGTDQAAKLSTEDLIGLIRGGGVGG